MSVICPSVTSTHLQRPRLEPAVGARPVLAERRLTVRRGRHEPRAAALRARPDPEVEHVVAARSHISYGGIDWVASSWISAVSASMS